ncbi:MAG TPA: DNA-binding protein, partial [Gammaproteobacteria bacterium]|nr:DNA-binding protein [Gammaproteobacteria bacterium]
MSLNETPDPDQTVRGAVAPPAMRFRNSVRNVKAWLAERAATPQPEPVEAGVPTNLVKAAGDFGHKLWELAIAQARVELDAERDVVRAQVEKAQAEMETAQQASEAARDRAVGAERHLTVATRAREEIEAQLAKAKMRGEGLQKQIEELVTQRKQLDERSAEAATRQAASERQIAELQKALDRAVEQVELQRSRQEQQLEKAKQHYAELESQLGNLLQH